MTNNDEPATIEQDPKEKQMKDLTIAIYDTDPKVVIETEVDDNDYVFHNI